jgi:hypothetical protein
MSYQRDESACAVIFFDVAFFCSDNPNESL